MEKGGYKIIDLKDTDLTTTETTLKGIYQNIGENNRKVLLLSGLKINGVELSDTFATCRETSGQYYISVYDVVQDSTLTKYNIVVSDDDTIVLQLRTVAGGASLTEDNTYTGTNTYDNLVTFNSGVEMNSDLLDKNMSAGSAGQVLTSTSDGVQWEDASCGKYLHNIIMGSNIQSSSSASFSRYEISFQIITDNPVQLTTSTIKDALYSLTSTQNTVRISACGFAQRANNTTDPFSSAGLIVDKIVIYKFSSTSFSLSVQGLATYSNFTITEGSIGSVDVQTVYDYVIAL